MQGTANMAIKIIKTGKVSADTKGPPSGIYLELMTDGIHCNPNQQGPYRPTPNPPVFAGWCLASYG
jgi:hypothetical protein